MKYINAIVRRTIAAVGGVLCCTFFTMPAFAELCADGVGVMSIAGRWRFALGDTTNCTDTIDLPSTTDIARKGNGRINARELEKIDPMRDDAYLTDALTRHPTRRFPYVGPATYERDVDVPAEWAGKRIELMIERTKYVSVFLDGKPIGRCETLATPAVVELPRGTSPGRHRLRLVVDNGLRGRPLSGHQISDDTQTNWNGVMGHMELRAYGEMSIVHVKTFPCAAENRVNVKVVFRNDGAKKKLNVEICAAEASALRQQAYNNKAVKRSFPYVAPCGVSTGEFNVALGPDAPKWSEFNPVLYRLTVKAGEASSTVKFGLRDFKTDGARFILNGRPVFLRGRLDSCVWPLTGAPPMEVEPWRRYFATLKEYGLNHVRFHSWCPPEAAFETADEAGFYLQPEFASFGGDMGRNVRLRTYCLAESKRILDTYANHPSFVMFTLGNEYCSGREARKAVVRDFSSAMRYCTIPIVAHETGQFQAYPDYSEIAKYTGVLKPLNFEVFRARLAKAGLLEYAADFSRASGRLMVINYREEMEEAFRTPGFDGFQLLDIQDYPGQGSALVGILDAFMDSKGFITPEEWRMACAPTVLLARFPRYTYVAGEKFCADVQIVHYGKEYALKGDLAWRIVSEGEGRSVVSHGTLKAEVPLGEVTTIGRIEVELPRTERARKFMLELSLTDGRAKNAYPLWVYPEVGGDVPQGVEIVRDLEAAEKALAEGRRALCILDQARAPTNSVPGFFASDFCCWALFNASCARRGGKNVAPGTLGLLVKDKHPALAGFPTSFHSDYQWRELIFKGVNVVLDGNKDTDVIVRGIDNVTLNRNLGIIWEKRRGNGRVVYCSLDLEAAKDLPEARALRRSLLDYMSTIK